MMLLLTRDSWCVFLCRVELSGRAEDGCSLPLVDVADVENIVASWTGIPVERMDEDEKEKLGRLVSGAEMGSAWQC